MSALYCLTVLFSWFIISFYFLCSQNIPISIRHLNLNRSLNRTILIVIAFSKTLNSFICCCCLSPYYTAYIYTKNVYSLILIPKQKLHTVCLIYLIIRESLILFFIFAISEAYHSPKSWYDCISSIYFSMIVNYIESTYQCQSQKNNS